MGRHQAAAVSSEGHGLRLVTAPAQNRWPVVAVAAYSSGAAWLAITPAAVAHHEAVVGYVCEVQHRWVHLLLTRRRATASAGTVRLAPRTR